MNLGKSNLGKSNLGKVAGLASANVVLAPSGALGYAGLGSLTLGMSGLGSSETDFAPHGLSSFAQAPFHVLASSYEPTYGPSWRAFDGVYGADRSWLGILGGKDWLRLNVDFGAGVREVGRTCSAVTASTSYYSPTSAIDDLTSTYWLGTSGGADWFRLDFGSTRVVAPIAYGIRVNRVPEPTRAPKDWKLQGSSDGSTWTDLHTATNQNTWATGELRTFTCSTLGMAYRYIRLNITANNGDSTYTQIGDLYLYEDNSGGDFGTGGHEFGREATVTASSAYLGQYTPDRITGESANDSFWIGTGSGTDWIKFDLGVLAREPAAYRIYAGLGLAETDRAPKDWKLQGSNDDSTWADLHTAVNQTGWVAGESRKFLCSAVGVKYRYIRLNITANNGNATYTQVYKVELYKTEARKPVKRVCTSYGIRVNTVPEPTRAPKDWTLEGSNDLGTWTVIDRVSNQTGWGNGELRTFSCGSRTAYQVFRLNITANNGDATYTQVGEWYLSQQSVEVAYAGSGGQGVWWDARPVTVIPNGAQSSWDRARVLPWVLQSASVPVIVDGSGVPSLGPIVASSSGTALNPVGGTVAANLGVLLSAAAGTVGLTGAVAKDLAPIVGSATGSVVNPVVGTVGSTLGLVVGATGWAEVRGTGFPVLGGVVGAAQGQTEIRGSAAATLGALQGGGIGTTNVLGIGAGGFGAIVGGGVGYSEVRGTGSAVLGSLIGAATGTMMIPVTGTGGVTLGSLLASGLGMMEVTCVGSAVLGPFQGTGTGGVQLIVVGAGSTTLAPIQSEGTGNFLQSSREGTVDAPLGEVLGTAEGTVGVKGSGSPSLGTLQGTGTGQWGLSGYSVSSLGQITSEGEGHFQGVAYGAVNATLGPIQGAGSARLTIAGQISTLLEPVTGVGSGSLVFRGPVSSSLGEVEGLAEGQVGHQGLVRSTIQPFTGSGEGTVGVAGTGSPTLPILTSASGALIYVARLFPALEEIEVRGSGRYIPPNSAGTGAGTLSALAAAALGEVGNTGQGTAELGQVQSSTSATIGVNGTGDGLVGFDLGEGYGQVTDPPSGFKGRRYSTFKSETSGAIGTQGLAEALLGELIVEGVGLGGPIDGSVDQELVLVGSGVGTMRGLGISQMDQVKVITHIVKVESIGRLGRVRLTGRLSKEPQ